MHRDAGKIRIPVVCLTLQNLQPKWKPEQRQIWKLVLCVLEESLKKYVINYI